MRKTFSFNIEHPSDFKNNLIGWAQQFDQVVWLDSNDYHLKYQDYDSIIAIDAMTCIQTDHEEAFEKLKEYQAITSDWIFGYLTYDLKNDLEALQSQNFDGLHFPELFFFQPKKIILIKGNKGTAYYLNMVDDEFTEDLAQINNYVSIDEDRRDQVKISLRMTKDAYFEKVNDMLRHIQRGDIYEANFCQEFYAENTYINPLETYKKLNQISKTPFATFLKVDDKYLLSASPERYIKKIGEELISQPIKGTAKRSTDTKEDQELKLRLETDEKERSENIMIVDLVRNDLSKLASKGSVEVKELCKVYTFQQVHQMISTVSAKIRPEIKPVDVLAATFPMGSMTGAPKISAMKIIEELEESKRGLYSGSVGYFSPEGNFDFNVVIRSILYNASLKYVSYSVGGAITAKSDPLNEYEECLIKAKAMRTVLEG
ncbi:MAG: aminodeoxychorismate synthase component I [Bacteroidia bacterium]|nr:aminodeoxychorismate synthase component I [Bacteroidia bacterium]MBT8279890.1 aminodeoxychorismate synthase component I [Bacteroidia bacterium]NNL33902.1 aminodeoxychorismate synthase component I [Flavobacteriaceae bacterium]RZW54207.1 MAG: aminodeoxychorismate synthase component I [Flavobacteriaceae bacterium]